ncbi:MAG: zinc ribbon domain-containing protein [Anaerolineaceae bacterium]|nr:zinc ribbon domain-containing protein [Anaerolineaceae bacterium]
MPTYTYHCESCGVRFDQYQKFTDEPLTLCPECGEVSLRKVFQPVGIVFKGSGFYSTDHRSPSGLSSPGVKNESSDEGKLENKKSDVNETNKSKTSESDKPSKSKAATESSK